MNSARLSSVMRTWLACIIAGLFLFSPADAGVQLRFAMSVSQPIVTAQTLTPSAAYTGVYGSGDNVPALDTTVRGSGYPVKPSAIIDTPQDMWIEPGCDGGCTGNNFTVGVVAGNADRAQIDHVDFFLGGNKVTVTQPSINPRTGTFAYNVNLSSGDATSGPNGGPGCNGDVKLVWDTVPVNGPARRMSRHFTLNTQSASNAACSFTGGSILHGSYYIDNAGSDGNAGSQAAPWKTIAKAMNAAPQGATIIITAGQTFTEDASNSPAAFYAPSAPCRMTRFFPSTAGGTYTVTRSNRYVGYSFGTEAWRINSCAAEFKGLTADLSKLNTIQTVVSGGSIVFSDFAAVDPSGVGGPDLSSANCASMAATPCLYSQQEGSNNGLFAGPALISVIDSARPSRLWQYGGTDLVVNWTNVQNAFDTIGIFNTALDKGWFNAQTYTTNAMVQRGTVAQPQNLKVSGVAYCTAGVSLTTTDQPYTIVGPSSYIELTRTETTYTGSISGNVLTVTGTVSNGPIVPDQVITGSGITAGTKINSYAGKNGSGQDTWYVSTSQTVADGAISTTGRETFPNAMANYGVGQNAVFGSGQGSLTDRGVLYTPLFGNATADIVGPAGDGSCAGQTLVRSGHPYIVSDCRYPGNRGTCDPDYRNAHTLFLDGTRQPNLAAAGTTISPVAIGQTVAVTNVGHSDMGQFGQANTSVRNHENVIFQGVDFRSVESQPFLYSTDNYGTTSTASQSGTTWTADPVSIASDSYNSSTGRTTLSYTGSSVSNYTVSSGISFTAGAASLSQNGSMGAGCSTSCTFTGTGTFNTTSFTRVLVPGDRVTIAGEPGVWRVDAVPDDATLTISSLTGMASVSVSGANVSKIGAALHFTSGALAGQEFPLADTTQASGGNIVVGDATAAAAGDTAYVNPGWQYGQTVHWWNCVGNSAANDSWATVLSIPAGNQAVLSHPVSCAAGSGWYRGTGNVGILYMGSIIATNINGAPNLAILGQVSGSVVGWGIIDSIIYGAPIYMRNAVATSSTYNGFGVDLSAMMDSIAYDNPNNANGQAITVDNGAPLVPQMNWNLDNNAFFGKTALSFGSPNSQAGTYDTLQIDVGFGSASFKPNFNGTTGLTQKKKGVRGNPNRPDGCPIYPVNAGVLLSCGTPSFVGARQP